MCEGITQFVGDAKKHAMDKAAGAKKKANDLLIDSHDANGRPVGIGGARRRRRIDEIVDSQVTGLQIPK